MLIAISAFSQTREENKMRVNAVKALNSGNFKQAQSIYSDLLKLQPDNPDYNYEMGLAIFDEKINRGKAAPYFDKAINNINSDTLPDMFLYAGKAEQFAGNFDIAIGHFQTYLNLMRQELGLAPNELEEDIPRYIEMCQNGKVQFENNKKYIRIDNMGKEINSEFADYAPVVSKDENIILFTSRRENTTGGDMDSDGKFYEDIYYALNINGQWSEAMNYDSTNRYMSNEINSDDHDAAITFASNETELYIYREENVWVSKLENGFWGSPQVDKGRINSKRGFEPSVFITNDEQTMFVVSDIPTGFGGRDIYMTTKDANDNWKPLESLGRTINTRFDEDAPFLTPDGNTLYFASNGHNSMGDYDIFKSVLDENGDWTDPENLGPPINTPGHDRYFVTTDEGAVGYYASDRDGGFGETDIYRIILDCKAVSATVIRGVVFSEDRQEPTAASITVFDGKTGKLINRYMADSETGKYEMRLKTETDYRFRIEADGYLPHSGDFTVPKQCDYYSLFQEIRVDNVEDSAGRVIAQRAFISNAFFDIDAKIEEDYNQDANIDKSDRGMDSLRSLVAEKYNPIELTNFVKTIDILDPNGIKLATEVVGASDVATIQARDEVKRLYNKNVVNADQYFYNDNLPEARANYVIAKVIDEQSAYPDQQINAIDQKLKDAPLDAFLATIPEVDESEMVVMDDGPIDDSQMKMDWNETAQTETPATEETPEVEIEQPIASEIKEVAQIEEVIDEEVINEESIEEPEIQETEEIAEARTEEVEEAVSPEIDTIEEVEQEIEEQTATIEPIEKATPKEEREPVNIVFRNILFDFDKSFLREESKNELTKISNYLSLKTAVEVQIDGHADWLGTPEYNMQLSEKRAKTASDFLLDKGVAESRVTYQFFGEFNPIAPNANEDGSDNPEGRQLNRRCEFKFDQKGTAQNVVLKF
ncbi:MAG: OmpA family protein [Salibacteraceae bacterium]